MTTLLLRLAGPMQAWGEESRFARRMTADAPTKSGIVGMLAAARGLRRTDPLEGLLRLRIGVRIDQPGRVERDFQTARTRDGSKSFPLTERFYLTDAVFVAAIEGDEALVSSLHDVVRAPRFPLYLGRRSCPPSGPIALGVRDGGAWHALNHEPWRAAEWWRKRQRGAVDLELRIDAGAVPDDVPEERILRTSTHHDEPASFDPRLRAYGWRRVAHAVVGVGDDVAADEPGMPCADQEARHVETRTSAPRPHDPLAPLGGG